MKDSDSSFSTISTSLLSEKSFEARYESDIVEHILYRTTQEENKTTMKFMSNAFFNFFYEKMKADFACSIEIDTTSFISKYTTHVKGVKCHVIIDSHFCTITVAGVGHKLWREYYFSKAAHSIFRRHLQDKEERDTDLSESRSQSSGEEYSTCSESSNTTNSDESSTKSSSMTSSDGSDTGTSNVASPNGSRILPSEKYIQPIHVSTPNARLSNPNAFVGMRKQGDMLQVQSDINIGDLSNKNQQQGSNVAHQVSFLVS